MSTITKSPRKVLLAAYATAQNVLPPYAHRFSPQKFTLAQLFACLVLKTFLKLDYRGIEAFLKDCPELCNAIGLTTVPHFSTLQKASQKLLQLAVFNRLLLETIRSVRKKKIKLAAIDSTGLESGHISPYFVKRRSRVPELWQTTHYTRFPKLAVIGDCKTHLILGAVTTRGPSVDVNQFRPLFEKVASYTTLKTILADAGYDSEANHCCAREEYKVESIIPPKAGRPTTKKSEKKYRRLMQTHFPKKTFGQRWQVETIFSMTKRRFGFVIHARSYWAQNRQMLLMVLTHNIGIILFVKELFYRADFTGFAAEPVSISPSNRKMGHEGSVIRKIGGKYVFFGTAWSTDEGRHGTYNLYYCVADKITGPYGPRKFAGRFMGHGTPFQDKEGKWWCTAFYNANVPPLSREELKTKPMGDNAYTINEQGVTIVPLEVKVLEDGDIYIRVKDPDYAQAGPEEIQTF
jgi:hypothetical protein